jgi:hypothetical protein
LIQCKGRGMWDQIVERYQERYEKKERAALQMQLSRAVLKLAVWPEDEVSFDPPPSSPLQPVLLPFFLS